jgi:hypothetical protein
MLCGLKECGELRSLIVELRVRDGADKLVLEVRGWFGEGSLTSNALG